ncbi:MAG: dihydropteroate synthase [Taibaiella sp.]|nr:dihydropteroate synthase [Taibaiella sp.]
MHTLTNRGKALSLSTPAVMGILNATPDSFYHEKRASEAKGLLGLAEIMLKDGASILDVGGESTRPGAGAVSPDEEAKRVLPAITSLRKEFPDVWISIDTYHAEVARNAVDAGADIVNDISGGLLDKDMLNTVAELDVPYIVMHIQGVPGTMQQDPQYNHVVQDVLRHLRQIISRCHDAGIKQVIADPGFGFGKTVEHNYELLAMLNTFSTLGVPVLAGLSRKSMICKPLKVSPVNALNGTTALNMAALMNGANILRVHDVREAIETVKLFRHLAGDSDGKTT